jgi:hypothetical protein
MTPGSNRLVLFLIAALALSFGVGSQCDQEPFPCPSVDLDRRAAVAGSMSWSLGSESGSQLFPGVGLGPGPPGTCIALAGGGPFFADESTNEVLLSESILVQCADASGIRMNIEFAVGDPRDLVEGTRLIDQILLEYPDICTDSGECSFCQAGDSGGLLTIEEAVGGSQEFPSMVTPDFQRRYRVEYTSQTPVRGTRSSAVASGVACTRTATADLSITFVIDQTDFVVDETRMCPF